MSVIEQHYRILGLNSRQCDLNDVKKAFKTKALQLHPDRNPNKSDDAFKRVHAAYEAILAYHHRNQRHSKQSNVGKSFYNTTSNMNNYYSHNSNSTTSNTKQSSVFTNYYAKPSEHTAQSSTPLFTEEELFGSHTIPGGWVFRDGVTRKPRFTSSTTTNTGDNAATRREANTTSTSNTPKLPELSSSQSSMKTAYEAAEQHWRQAHGPRVPVSGYKSPFHIPSGFTETTRNSKSSNNDYSSANATTNGESYNSNNNNSINNMHKDVEDVKAKYKQYREEQQQNLHLLAQQHAQLHNGKMTAFEFSKYSTAEEKKAALHERWNSLEKNISNKISVADDLVGNINHDHNNYTTSSSNINNNNKKNNVNVTKHYSCAISPDEAALLMAEVAAMSEKRKKNKINESNNRTEEKEEETYEEKEWEDLQNEEFCREECKSHELTEDEEELHCNNNVDNAIKKYEKVEMKNYNDSKCDLKYEQNSNEFEEQKTSTDTRTSIEEKGKEEDKYVEEKEETQTNEHKRTSEAHRDELSHERRELMYQLFYQQYAPDPALVSQMSDAELHTLLQLFHDVSNKLEKVFNARLTSSHCSRCGKYGIIGRPTAEANDEDGNPTMMDEKEITFVQENSDSNKEKSKENGNVKQVDEKATSIRAKVNAFNCTHVCVCEECAKWATECPLCGASVKNNIKRDVQTTKL